MMLLETTKLKQCTDKKKPSSKNIRKRKQTFKKKEQHVASPMKNAINANEREKKLNEKIIVE